MELYETVRDSEYSGDVPDFATELDKRRRKILVLCESLDEAQISVSTTTTTTTSGADEVVAFKLDLC